jgi:hypothetical protein
MEMIDIKDKFLVKEDVDAVTFYCENASYVYGETDGYDLPPTGMIHEIEKRSSIYKLFESKTKPLVNDNLFLYRMYINCFAPSEQPYFHKDGDPGDITFLYYVNKTWNYQEGGETQFIVNNEIYGVTPIPNRMVYFDASILHRATAFRNRHRFTIAIKYGV